MVETTQPTQAGYTSFDTFNGCFPKEGPRCIPVVLVFDGATAQTIDFLGQTERLKISMVQGVFVDNSENSGVLTITANSTRQKIQVQPGCQGYFPILVNNPPRFLLLSSEAATVGLQFFNFPMSPLQWGPQGGGGSLDLTAGSGIVVTPSPITGTGEISASVDGTTIGFNGGGELESLVAVPSAANPSATAGPVVIDGVAPTFMRSDGAPAVQKGSAVQFGIVAVDGTTIDAPGGIISVPAMSGGDIAGTIPDLSIILSGGSGNFYQAGNWTPTIAGSVTAGANTYTIQEGTYVRIGSVVFFAANVALSALDPSLAGNVEILGLPFSAANIANNQIVVNIIFSAVTLASGYTQVIGLMKPNQSIIGVAQQGSGETNVSVVAADLANNTIFRSAGFFFMAQP